jgi:hypothetical protein
MISGLEKNRPHMLLAVIVRQKLKAHGVELDLKQKHKHDTNNGIRAIHLHNGIPSTRIPSYGR